MAKSNTPFTIITVNYNNAAELRRTIESVVRQDFDGVEYIIVDGGSTDGSVDVIREYADHIDQWVSEPDGGIFNAMNKGVAMAHGDYINFMNSGDSFYSNDILTKVYNQIEGEDIIFGNVCDNATGKRYGGIPAGSEVTFLTLKKEILCHQATFYRRQILINHPYDESIRIIADWKTNVQAVVMDNCKVKVIDTMIARYDLTGVSSTNSQLHAEERQIVMEQLLPPRVLKDYERLYTESEMPIVGLLPQIKERGRLQHIIYKIVQLLLKIS